MAISRPASLAGNVRLELFDPLAAPSMTRACHEMYLAGAPADDPLGPPMTERVFAGWLALGWTEEPREIWLARDASGRPWGWYTLDLPARENRHRADLKLLVSPASRRQGIGTRLAAHAAARAHADDRPVLGCDALAGSAAEAFFRALGGQPGIAEIRRVLRLAVVPGRHLARLRGQASQAAAGYSLLHWAGEVPAGQLAGVAAINDDAAADMPHDPGYEPQRWDAERVRQSGQRAAAQGVRTHTVAARHDVSGDLAGLTEVAIDPADPQWGFQELTAVTRAHRGHRLGLLLKVAMIELLRECEPQLQTILTGNADSNRYMIAINEALGFEVLDRFQSWELDTATILKRAQS